MPLFALCGPLLLGAAAPRALPPEVAQALVEAVKGTPALALKGGQIERDRAHLELCLSAAPETCGRALLSDPQAGCGGEITGPWCLAWEVPPPAALTQEVRVALATLPPSVWRTLASEGEAPPQRGAHPETLAPDGRWLLLGLHLIAPLLLGAALGWALGGDKRRPWLDWPWLAILPALGVALSGLAPKFSPFDFALTPLLAATAFAVARSRPSPGKIAFLLIWSGALLGLVEWGLGRSPSLELDQGFSTDFRLYEQRRFGSDPICGKILRGWGDPADGPPQRGVGPRPGWIAHIGDSMVFGDGVEPEQAIPALLERALPGTRHTNRGMPRAGPDVQAWNLADLLSHGTPEHVVFHLFAGNDMTDLDRQYLCCEGETFLRYEGEGAQLACPSPGPGQEPLRWRTYRGQSPALLRALKDHSYLARRLAHLSVIFRYHLVRDEAPVDPERWAHLRAALALLRDMSEAKGARFTVVAHPFGDALSVAKTTPELLAIGNNKDPARHHKMVAIARDLGLEVIDLEPLIQGLLDEAPIERWYHDRMHYTPEGHARVADFLVGALGLAPASAEEGGPPAPLPAPATAP